MMREGALRAGLAIAGIFALGLLAGTVAGRAWARRTLIPVPPNAHEFTVRQLERMTKDFGLTEEQVARIQPRMEVYAEQLKDARRRAFEEVSKISQAMNAELEAELTPEQVALHRAYLEKQRERFERDASRRRAGESGKGPPLRDDGEDSDKRPPPPPDGEQGPPPAVQTPEAPKE